MSILALTFLLTVNAAAQSGNHSEPSQDPAGKRAAEIVALLNAGDRSAAAKYARNHFHPSLLAQGGIKQAVEILFAYANPSAPIRIERFSREAPGRMAAWFATPSNGRPGISVMVESAPPHRILGFGRAGAAPAQPPVAAPKSESTAPTARSRQQVVDSIASLLRRYYVYPDTGELIASHLERKAAAGAYAELKTTPEFVEALALDLKAVNGDKHLNVRTTPSAGGAPGALFNPESARRANYNFQEIRHLAGNVGYLKLTILNGLPEAYDVATHALRFLGTTDAMIIDLRGTPGGSPTMVNFLISHFTPPEQHSLTVENRIAGTVYERYTLDEVPGPRRTDIPLYVLVDKGSGSAAEDLPFVLQNLGRAVIVGEQTAGAGHNNKWFPVGDGLEVSISFSRVTDPKSGKEWEKVGVTPDLKTSSEDALDAAYLHALEQIARRASDEEHRTEITLVREFMEAESRPVEISPQVLASYAGAYEGGRIISVSNGRLRYQPRAELPPKDLVAISESSFALSPAYRINFVRNDAGTLQLELVQNGDRLASYSKAGG